jgi:phosphinothricin acetyltransferase
LKENLIKIRKAEIRDIKAITDIYNHAILNTTATFDKEKKSISDRKKWFNSHGSKNPILVAEINKEIVGWASLSSYSDKLAYSDTAELSVYVKEDFQGKGVGKKLIMDIVKAGEKAGLHSLIARITEGNEKSVYIHKVAGFKQVGIYKEVGFKFGKKLDVYLMQKVYK